MKIYLAKKEDINFIYNTVQFTISAIYPYYYPNGAVEFFLSLHSRDNILTDIDTDNVYLLSDNGENIGTITIKKNEICRLFVLPQFQGKGYGRFLMDFAENKIFQRYKEVEIASSLSAKQMYIKRGYLEKDYNIIKTDNGDCLCYDTMIKMNKSIYESVSKA